MRVALINPPWSFEGSIYFGCREPHLPIELGYTQALLEARGHEAQIIDASLESLTLEELVQRTSAFAPDATLIVTAPSYLFWRCPPPELTIPMRAARALRSVAGLMMVAGPHGSTTPASTLQKMGADVVIMGECEEVALELVETPRPHWGTLSSITRSSNGSAHIQGSPRSTRMQALPPLRWSQDLLERHTHHHHRFGEGIWGPGAELEFSRGCPYACTFCAKETHRDRYRRRALGVVLEELDGMIAAGVRYVYFIDELFLPDERLLSALMERDVLFGVQLRIDNWSLSELELLGRAGCVSIEAGVESITPEGRSLLRKKCRLLTSELSDRLIHAKKHIPFVQANLLDSQADDPDEVRRWRDHLRGHGVWANDPVPLFPYPGSPDYSMRWGPPDDAAWERAVEHYLSEFDRMSEIQDARPLPLDQLERA